MATATTSTVQQTIHEAQTTVPLPGELVVHLPVEAFDPIERLQISTLMRMVEILANILGRRVSADVIKGLSDNDTIRAAAAYYGENTMSFDVYNLKARLTALLTQPDRRGMQEVFNMLCSGSHCDPASRPHSYDSAFFLAQADPGKTDVLHAINGLYRYDNKKAVFDLETFKEELKAGTPIEDDVSVMARDRMIKGPKYDNEGKSLHGFTGTEWPEDLRRNYSKLKDAAFDLFFQLLGNIGDNIRHEYLKPGERLYDLNTLYQDKDLQMRKFFRDHFQVEEGSGSLNSIYDLWDVARGDSNRSAQVEDLFAN